jgi:hypothetical protein
MIIIGNFEFIFCKKNIKLLKPLKKYKKLIKNEDKTTKVFEQVVVKSTTHMNLRIFIRLIKSKGNFPQLIRLNKIVFAKERIILLWILYEVF